MTQLAGAPFCRPLYCGAKQATLFGEVASAGRASHDRLHSDADGNRSSASSSISCERWEEAESHLRIVSVQCSRRGILIEAPKGTIHDRARLATASGLAARTSTIRIVHRAAIVTAVAHRGTSERGASRQSPGRDGTTMAVWLVGYLMLFGMLTVQDRLSGPQPVPYTEFKTQVANKNVAELFARGDSIEGQLKKAVPVPGQQDRSYQQFTTERPTFANDDLAARADGRTEPPCVRHRWSSSVAS